MRRYRKKKPDIISAIGHNNIARHVGMGTHRMSIILEKYDILYVVSSRLDKECKEVYNYRKIIIT